MGNLPTLLVKNFTPKPPLKPPRVQREPPPLTDVLLQVDETVPVLIDVLHGLLQDGAGFFGTGVGFLANGVGFWP